MSSNLLVKIVAFVQVCIEIQKLQLYRTRDEENVTVLLLGAAWGFGWFGWSCWSCLLFVYFDTRVKNLPKIGPSHPNLQN